MLGLDKTQDFGPSAVLTSVIGMFVFMGISDTSLFIFLKGHIYYYIFFNTFERS